MLSLAATLARFPADRLAVVHGDERWSYGQLEARSSHWARWLADKGVRPDDLVAFSRANGPEFLAISFGIYKAGATPAPISDKLPDFERDAILAVMRPAVFIDQPDQPGDATGALVPVHVAASWKACTSGGSTGTPKVIVDGRAAGFAPGTEFIGIPDQQPVLVPGPLYHNACFSAAVFALWKGCTVCTMARFDAAGALAVIAAERVTWSIMVPTMLHRIWSLSNRHDFDLTSWKMVVHTASPMAQWLKQGWIDWLGPDHICEVYGATEGLVRCWIDGREWLDRPGSVGKPIGGARLRIIGDTGEEVAAGEQGEIYAMPPAGPRSTYHYLGAERRITADGWESVGDIGHVDDQGYLFLADRRSDLIISGGINIWPAEVEAAILRHPAVASCAVIGVANADLGEAVHAVIEAQDHSLTAKSLSAFLAPWLVRAKHPRSITLQSTPVRDDAGKFRKTRKTQNDPA